jgi:hypothetical protein
MPIFHKLVVSETGEKKSLFSLAAHDNAPFMMVVWLLLFPFHCRHEHYPPWPPLRQSPRWYRGGDPTTSYIAIGCTFNNIRYIENGKIDRRKDIRHNTILVLVAIHI